VSDGEVSKFLGIRYATSPAGDNRWLPSRLGALGWLADKPLEDANGDSGNYGLMDEPLAMKWVAAGERRKH
jgi:carboxylesterase type B